MIFFRHEIILLHVLNSDDDAFSLVPQSLQLFTLKSLFLIIKVFWNLQYIKWVSRSFSLLFVITEIPISLK